MAIAEDASTPGSVGHNTNLAVTSSSFTPPSNSLVVVLHAWGYTNNPVADPTVTCTSSDGGTWTLLKQYLNLGTWHGEISWWGRYYTSSPGAITVTTTITSSIVDGASHFQDTRVLTGAADIAGQTGAFSNVVVTPPTTSTLQLNTTITPNTVDSWVYGIGNYSGANGTDLPASSSGNTNINNFYNSTNAHRNMSNRRTAATVTAGVPVTVGWTVPGSVSKYGQAAFYEILPSTGPVIKNGTDTGAFTDTATVKITGAADTGTAVDNAPVINHNPAVNDIGTFTETATAGQLVPAADTGAFVDNATAVPATVKIGFDQGTFDEFAQMIEPPPIAMTRLVIVREENRTFTVEPEV